MPQMLVRNLMMHSKRPPQDSEPQQERELMRPWYSPGWNGQTEQRATRE